MKFLIDECLSPSLVKTAHQAGYDAQHVAHLGEAGWKDWHVLRLAGESERILVTNNAVDFRRLYARQELHPGLVVILPNADKAVDLVDGEALINCYGLPA